MMGGTVLTCSAQEQENIEVSDNFNAEGLPILNEKETFTIAVVQTSSLRVQLKKHVCLRQRKLLMFTLNGSKFQNQVGQKK